MKPCYCYGEELLVLAQVAKEGDNLWESCKARISQGTPPSITTICKTLAARAGWCTVPDGDPSEGSHQETPAVLHCKLRVGRCELSTDVHVVDRVTSSEQGVPFKWYIHLGESVVKTLICANWDADICYLDGLFTEGSASPLADTPSCCGDFQAALDSGHKDCIRYWHRFLRASVEDWSSSFQGYYLLESARLMSAEVLMHAHDVLSLSLRAGTCDSAALAGSIDCLSYAHCSGCPWGANVCMVAALAGKMACLVYAHAHGCEWDGQTCEAAAGHGRTACLVYAHEHGCDWNRDTCAAAARSGHLDCLVYAHTHGCQWDEATCRGAARSGKVEVLAYALGNGCPWDESTCNAAAHAGSMSVSRTLTSWAVHGVSPLAFVQQR